MRPLACGAWGAAGLARSGVVNFGWAEGGGGALTTGPLKFGSGNVSMTAGDAQPAAAKAAAAQENIASRAIRKAIRGPLLFGVAVDDDIND
jgi:hypothetical protein